MVTRWCVKITCLPEGSSNDELAKKFGVDPDTIDIPRNQQGPNYYAWVNGFSSEQHANDFITKWNGQRIRTGTIRCKVSPTKGHVASTRPSLVSRIAESQSRQDGDRSQYNSNSRPQSAGTGRIMASMLSNEDYINDDSDDEVTSQSSGLSTRTSRLHTVSAARRSPSYVWDDLRPSCMPPCRNGSSCFNAWCSFWHPPDWFACDAGVDCEVFECKGNHPPGRTNPCSQGDQCKYFKCKFLHPPTRMDECDAGDQCREWNCQSLHSENRPKPCFYKQHCYNIDCLRLHPPDRQLCSSGVECIEFTCKLTHPEGRMNPCDQGNACDNYYCMYLHPQEWDPCKDGKECTNPNCSHISHPLDRFLLPQQRFNSRTDQLLSRKKLKSIEQREIDRQQAKLPILASKDEFCQRMKEERVLVVRAETGSGKSTQLPQYAAECFGGLVVCTQPRVPAAISLARRVANEYDGGSVGESVGYQVGSGGANRGNNRVPGRDIIFMTDSALIQESQRDSQLSKVKVLIIDEAHERSLNTDIVIGLAKLLLDSRPKDFYVVIASATIDPAQFLTFFNRDNCEALNVPGRVFEVSLEYMPKPDDADDYEVSTVLKLYKERPQGHILVFLPGQREIEKALTLFNRAIPDDCVALPLYGSLSSEEQDRVLQFDEGPTMERRMVVFCTNVAETSLTIKNVRLVIDSGLAKEARFDLRRRLTVIETVRISKSSANQRKGRAGRTAPGHCVRLYNEDELIRTNIEPEILRSSLDLVILQLLRLNLNPNKFPFVSPPDDAVLKASLQLLRQLQCIDTNETITPRGELFVELGLDPRLSAFMVDTYIEHGPILDLTATVVAILTAPGSLFFMGGTNKEEKQAVRGRIAMGAQEHDSDLMYLVSVYKKWQNVGIIDSATRTCLTCKTLIKRYSACRSCRIAYTIEHALNNKTLNIIEIASKNAIETITNKRWNMNPGLLTEPNENDIMGTYLLKNFPEQRGHLLISHLPNEGVRMVNNQIRARITNTSVFVQRRVKSRHFIAMSITQLSTGDYVIERLHPLNIPENTCTETLSKLCHIPNVGWEWNSEMRKQITNLENEQLTKWLVYEHNRRSCELVVWGEENVKEPVIQALTSIANSTLDSLFACTRPIECGPIYALFESGLNCSRIENLHHNNSEKYRIDLQHVPCQNFEELDEWLESALQVHLRDIQENNFQPCRETVAVSDDYEAQPFFIVFKFEEMFRKALANISSYHICPRMSDSANVIHMSEKNLWGRQLLLKFSGDRFYTEKDHLAKLGRGIISCKQLGKKLLPGIQLNNMPAGVDEVYIQSALGRDLTWTRINILSSDGYNPGIGSTSARVYFNNEQLCNEACRRLRLSYFRQPHPITIIARRSGNYKQILVEPTVEKLEIEPQTFICTARSRQDALRIYSRNSRSVVDSSSSVTVIHLEFYSNFKNLLQYICNHFKVRLEELPLPTKNNYSVAVRCIITGASPPVTAMAASHLSQATSPIIIKLSDDRQKCLFNELFNEGLIEKWTKELKLLCERKDKYGALIEIYGPQVEQGQLMRYIADYSDQFDHRYRILDLSPEVVGYFGRQKAADVKLQEINTKWTPEGCTVTFVRRTSSILLYAQPNISVEKIKIVEKEIKQLLEQLVITDIDEENSVEQQDFARQCAFCHHTTAVTRTFRICGHAYCRCAVSSLNQSPMQCPTCKFRIHIQDIQDMFSNHRTKLIQLCKSSIQTYLLDLEKGKNDDQLFCPNGECNGLIIRSQGYQTCLTCGQSVCAICRLMNDELHEGRTCAERDEVQRNGGEFLSQLFQKAEEFVKDNWSSELPSVLHFVRNGYLLQTGCESLQRFYNGVKSVGDTLPPDIARGCFAFHGTSETAIEPICQSGFDPRLRRGQVHGPGEYFGVTAAISHGYTKNDSSSSENKTMIIAFILQCNRASRVKNFCYVVNNPVDCSAAFNLPVAAVIYGKNSSKIHPALSTKYTASSSTVGSTGTSSNWKSQCRVSDEKVNAQSVPVFKNNLINLTLQPVKRLKSSTQQSTMNSIPVLLKPVSNNISDILIACLGVDSPLISSNLKYSIEPFDDECAYIDWLLSITNKRIYFIVSNSVGEYIIPLIHQHRCIEQIYVYCSEDNQRNAPWITHFPKVNSWIDYKSLLTAVHDDIQSILPRSSLWSNVELLERCHTQTLTDSLEESFVSLDVVNVENYSNSNEQIHIAILHCDNNILFHTGSQRFPLSQFSNVVECVQYLEKTDVKSVFFIISGEIKSIERDLKEITMINQICAIYLFAEVIDEQELDETILSYKNIHRLFDDLEILLNCLTADIKFYLEQLLYMPTFLVFTSPYNIKDKSRMHLTDKQEQFTIFQLFVNTLREAPSSIYCYQKLYDRCLVLAENQLEGKHASKMFSTDKDQVFAWFRDMPFLSVVINSFLQEKFPQNLLDIQPVIITIDQHLTELSQITLSYTVYRVQLLREQDRKTIQKNVHALIAFHTYFVATKDLLTARTISRQAADRGLSVVMFQIEVPSQAHVVELDKDRFIFRFGAIFRIRLIDLAPNGVYYCQLKYADLDFQSVEERLQIHVGERLTWLTLGKYLCTLNHSSDAKFYYEYLLKTLPNSHEALPSVYNNMGLIYAELGDHEAALKYYSTATDLLGTISQKTDHAPQCISFKTISRSTEAITTVDCCTVYEKIAEIYLRQSEYSKALDYYRKALELATNPISCIQFEQKIKNILLLMQ